MSSPGIKSAISCAEVRDLLVLYGYGELAPAEEERVEAHLDGCAECRAEQTRHTGFLAALDARTDSADPSALLSCRNELRAALEAEHAHPRRESVWAGWFESLRDFSRMHIPFRVPVGAMALVAVGFFAARYTPERFGGVGAGVAPMFSSVRSVEAGTAGNVEIAVDDVRRRVVTGSLHDEAIQALLLSAVREEANPGVRVESIGVLGSGGDSDQVMRALIDAATHDPDAGVRLKAVEGLKQYAGNGDVRRTLAGVLVKDDNPGVRVQAVDMLTAHHDPSIVGMLQDAFRKEDNNYIRERCRRLLETMKASVGTY